MFVRAVLTDVVSKDDTRDGLGGANIESDEAPNVPSAVSMTVQYSSVLDVGCTGEPFTRWPAWSKKDTSVLAIYVGEVECVAARTIA